MYFTILVTLVYLNVWLTLEAANITKMFRIKGDVRGFAVFGYVTVLSKGASIGYAIWYMWYCFGDLITNLFK